MAAVNHHQQQKKTKHREMDKKRWFVRYLILVAVGIVLSIKVYMALFVMDFAVGLYSVITSFILFNVLLIAYTKYKDPFYDHEGPVVSNDTSIPLVSIIIPVKNEEDNIRNCVQSCINSTYSNKEIIVVNDGSTDMTPKIIDEIRKEQGGEGSNLHIIHLSKSVGKKKAIEAASEIAKGEIYASMDSDCDMDRDAVKNAVKIFVSDRKIGALTGHGRVRCADTGNILQKMQDVYIDGSCRALKGMESSFSSVTCCSGSLSFFRREAIQSHLHSWAHDSFLGIQDFKFATDRRLTAYVLAGQPPPLEADSNISSNLHNEQCQKNNNIIPILQTGKDNLEIMKSSSDPDMVDAKKGPRYYWKIKYSQSVKVNVGVPYTLSALIRQQIRWRKSFIRSLFTTGVTYWRRPFPAALLYYLQLALKFFRPYIVLKALIFLPLSGDFITALLYFSGVFFTGMIYGVDFRLRNPGNSLWLYRPVFTFLTTFVYTWLIFYAAMTIKKTAWR